MSTLGSLYLVIIKDTVMSILDEHQRYSPSFSISVQMMNETCLLLIYLAIPVPLPVQPFNDPIRKTKVYPQSFPLYKRLSGDVCPETRGEILARHAGLILRNTQCLAQTRENVLAVSCPREAVEYVLVL